MGISTVAAFCDRHDDGYVLWIDAHADLNLPAVSPTGHLHGMPLAILLNLDGIGERCFPWIKTYLKSDRLIYLGLRDLDPFESKVIRDHGIRAYTYTDICGRGMDTVANEIFEFTAGSPLHVSFDIDSLLPRFAPSTGVPVPGGLTLRDLDILASRLFSKSDIPSIDVVEINPLIGTEKDVEQTYRSAIHFVESALSVECEAIRQLQNYQQRNPASRIPCSVIS